MMWREQDGKLVKEFAFANFVEAVGFINRILPVAEEANHHPDILLHAYKHVKVMLSTHAAGAVTAKDRALAKRIDALL